MSRKVWNLIVAVGLLFFVQPTSGSIVYVDASATGPIHDGSAWCRAFTDVQDGLAAAGPDDEIRVANGVYRPDGGTGDRWATFRLKDRVVLLGGYAGCGAVDPGARDFIAHETVLTGDLNGDDGPDFANYGENSYHVVTYDDPSATGVVLDGFTVTSGNADGADALTSQGGGIHIRQGEIKCLPGGPTIRNCVIEKNWAAHHGAVNNHAFTTVIENCTFRDNYAGQQGAGLLIHSGSGTVTGTTFVGNVTDGEGGGAWISRDTDPTCAADSSRPVFIGCTFTANRAQFGGGLFSEQGSSPTIRDCLFEDNVGTAEGGGLHSDLGEPVVEGTTFIRNESVLGGGAWLGSVSLSACSGPCKQMFVDCAFIENEAADGAGVYTPSGASRPVLTNVLFERNRGLGVLGSGYGGAMYVANGKDVRLTDCVFRDNLSVNGGGFVGYLAVNVTMVGCSFIGNRAVHAGGAVVLHSDDGSTFWNCRFVGNRLDLGDTPNRNGGGIQSIGPVTIVNSLFHGNFAWNGSGIHAHLGGVEVLNSTVVDGVYAADAALAVQNSFVGSLEGASNVEQVVVQHACIGGGGWPSGTGNINVDSLDDVFVNVRGPDGTYGNEDDDLRMIFGSPCVDAGDNAAVTPDVADLDGDGNVGEPVPFDVAGGPRIVGASVDIGAYELQDCNGNGIRDDEDIANGTSTDCDDNGVPDECDPDCNGNDTADGCEPDGDADGTIDACDGCRADPAKTAPGQCGCGVPDADSDGDSVADCRDRCPGFDDHADCDRDGTPDGCELDGDGDGVIDDCDGCPSDPAKVQPGVCGCGVPDADSDGDSVLDCVDACEGFDDFADADGDGVPDGCDQCPGADDTLDCNHNGYADACEVADGIAEDQDNNGVPDECDIMPSLTPEGCRALAVTPAAGAAPVALRVSLLGDDCLSGYLGPDGLLVSSPVFRTPDQWSTVVLAGPEIVPSTQYEVEAAFGDGAVSAAARAATARWGDVMGMSAGSPPDGQVNVVDITAVINCFRNLPTAPPLHRCDLQPAVPDGVVNVTDVTAAVDGFRGLPYPHGGPCP